jgi:hypothetical protein
VRQHLQKSFFENTDRVSLLKAIEDNFSVVLRMFAAILVCGKRRQDCGGRNSSQRLQRHACQFLSTPFPNTVNSAAKRILCGLEINTHQAVRFTRRSSSVRAVRSKEF